MGKNVNQRKKNYSLKKEIYKYRFHYLMLAPFALLFLTFTVISVLSSMGLSLTSFNMLQAPDWTGLDNYTRLFFEDDIFLIAVRNTLIFAMITGPLSYFICLLFAWLVNELGQTLRVILTFIFFVPSISGNIYVVWSYIFSSDSYGLANALLISLGIINEPVYWLADGRYMLWVIIIVQLWSSLGTSFLSFIAGLQGVDGALYEAGAIDGIRTRFQEFRLITLPSMGPQLMFAAVMQIGAAFAVSNICNQLAGFPSTDYQAHTIVTHALDHGTLKFEMGYACAIATVLFVVMAAMNSLVKAFLHKKTNL